VNGRLARQRAPPAFSVRPIRSAVVIAGDPGPALSLAERFPGRQEA
jgi:hypothetical protein